MIRVAFLTPSLHIGGAERWIAALCRNFVTVEPAAVIHTNRFAHHQIERQISRFCPVLRPERGGWSGWQEVARRAVEKRRADVVISWCCPLLPALRPWIPAPVIEVSHSDGAWSSQSLAMQRGCYGADFWVAVSQAAATAFPPSQRDRVTVIYNGAEVDRVTPRLGREIQRERWGVRPDQKVALFLGRFAEVKRVDRLIRAAAFLDRSWRIELIGHGPLQKPLADLADDTAPSRVHFHDPISHVGDALAAADVFVLPSESEGHPLALNEAWLAGTPAVTTRFAFIGEMTRRHGPLTHTVEQDAPPADLATAIITAHEDGASRATHAQQTAWRSYTASAMAARWETFLAQLVAEWRPARSRRQAA